MCNAGEPHTLVLSGLHISKMEVLTAVTLNAYFQSTVS